MNGGTAARLGGSSRCAASAGMLGEAAPENAAAAPRGAAWLLGAPAAIPAGSGPRLAGRGAWKGRREVAQGSRRAAAPGGDLPERGIDLAGGRHCLPRTGGRPGRLIWAGEAEIAHRQGLPEFAAFRGGRRLRSQPYTGSPEAPPGEFSARKDTGAIEKNDPRQIEEDASEQVTWFSYNISTKIHTTG